MNKYNPGPHPGFPAASICTAILFRVILAAEADTAEQHPQNPARADPESGLSAIVPPPQSKVTP
jgi:hypothetical protein